MNRWFRPALRRRGSKTRRQVSHRFAPRVGMFRAVGWQQLEGRVLLTAQLVVNTVNDSGAGSLRDAITQANTDGGADISFNIPGDSAANPQTITLGSNLPAIAGAVTITGPGADQLTISGSGNFQVFSVAASATVSLSGLTITLGAVQTPITDPLSGKVGAFGGAVLNDGALTLNDDTFTFNQVNSSTASPDGGAIANFGTLTVNGSTFSGNTAAAINPGGVPNPGGQGEGGAIASFGTLTVNNSTFNDNSAPGTLGTPEGGAIFSDGTLTITGSTFSGNTASGTSVNSSGGGAPEGGAVYAAGTATITGSSFSGNAANAPSGVGGALANFATLSLADCTFTGNSAGLQFNSQPTSTSAGGGAIYNSGTAAISVTTISGNTVFGTGSDIGGGIDNTGSLTVVGSTISGNAVTGSTKSVGEGGGGIASSGTLTLVNSTIANNSVTGQSGVGGGVYLTGGTATITNGTVSGNSVTFTQVGSNPASGGGGIANSSATLNLNNAIVANNTIDSGGAGPDIEGAVTSADHSLVGIGDGSSGITNGTKGNQVGTAASPLDPKLGPLQNNGGPTQTMQIFTGSPAIDAGDNGAALDPQGLPLTTDQRGAGFPRILNGTVDIGAFEYNPPPNLVVNTTADDSDGGTIANPDGPDGTLSLREAIEVADEGGGGANITFNIPGDNAQNPQTITLTSPLPAITDQVTITGPGANELTVSGNDLYQVLDVTASATATISDLTIAHGLVDTAITDVSNSFGVFGGAVLNDGSLTLDDDLFANNTASTDSSGSTPQGGAIANFGTLSVNSSTFNNNSAVGSDAEGGAIASFGTLSVNGSTFEDNSAVASGQNQAEGGAIFTYTALTVSGSTFTGNSAASPFAEGGAIMVQGSGQSPGQWSITGSTFSQNSANGFGGIAGAVYSGIPLSATASTFTNNTAGSSTAATPKGQTNSLAEGGALYCNDTTTIASTTISGNTVLGIGGDSGGGIYGGNFTVVDSVISGNTVNSGTQNSSAAERGGGGIAAVFGSESLTNCTIANNSATGYSASGGGIAAAGNNKTLTLTNCTVAGNAVHFNAASTGSEGGGIFAYSGGTANLTNTIVANNTIDAGGVGPDLSGAVATADHNLVGIGDGSNGITNGTNGNQVGTVASSIDPRLGSLANNGGPTETMALQTGSPAIDKGDNAAITIPPFPSLPVTDQRGSGFPRVVNGTVDIGAFEAGTATPSLGQVQFSAATYNANETDPSATITLTRSGGSSGAISVTVGVGGGTAINGTDYNFTSQVVNWADGDAANKTVTIPLIDDKATGESTQTVNLALSNATGGATIGTQNTSTLDIAEDNDVAPGTITWTGGSTTSSNWSDPANWDLNRAPVNGDSVVFPDENVARTTNTNDISGLSLNSITFGDELNGPTANPYIITGQGLTVGTGGISDGVAASSNALHTDQLNLDITLSANQTWSMTTTSPSINASRFETLVLGGTVTLGSFNLDLVANTGETNDVFQFGAAINGAGKLTVDTGAGAIVWLTQADGYTGGTLVNSGTLLVTADGALGPGGTSDGGTTLGNGSNTVGNEAGLVVDTSYNTPEAVTIDNGVIAGGFNPVSATVAPASFAGPITFSSSNGQLDIALAGEPFTLTGNVTFGNFDLHAVNENPTTAATLIVDGTMTGGGTLQVVSGANFGANNSGPLTLAGTGTVKAPITISGGSTLRPGGANAATDTGILSNTGNVTFQANSKFSVQLNGTSAGQFDQLSSTGTVDLGNAALNLSATGSFPAGSTFVIVKAGAPITTTFLNLPEGSTTFAGSQNFTVSYKNDEVTLTVPGATTPTTITWTGKSQADSNWSDAANWDLNRAPIDGDILVFPAGAQRLANTNDFTSLSVAAIQFQGDFGTSTTGYTLGGNTVTIGAGGIVDNSTFTGTSGNLLNQVNLNVALSVVQSWIIHDSNNAHHLTVNGNVANGGFGLIATGNGTIDVAGAISGSGSLTVAEGNTSSLITLDLHHANSYTGGTSVISGILDVFADGALGLGGANDVGTTVTANGTLLFHAVSYATPEKLLLDGTVGNDSGDSSFAGPITISGSASGTGNGLPVAVDAQVSDFSAGTFTLNGPTLVNNGNANLFIQGGNTTLGGSSNVVIDNVISGKGGLLLQAANVQLSAANTYQGSTFLNGAAQLTVGVDDAIPTASAVIMHASGTPILTAPLNTTTAAFDNSNTILVGGHSDTIGSLAGTERGGANTVDLGSGGSLTTGSDNSSTTFVGDIKGSGSLTKQGTGTFELASANDFTGTTDVQGGTLLVDGSTATGNAVTVEGRATLGGTGTIADKVEVLPGGTLSPGAFPDPAKDTGTLSNTAGVTFANGSSYVAQLGGTAANPTNDQLNSAGTVTLGGAVAGASVHQQVAIAGVTLNLTALAGAGPFSAGQQFVIVQSGQPMTTTFFGLPEGSTISDGSQNFTVSYANDRVTLTVQSPPAGQTATYINGQPGDGTAATFVHNLYRELLGREPDPAGQSFWVSLYTQLSTSGTAASAQQQMVAGFLASAEYRNHLVTGIYHDLLHRAPEAGGLQFWLSAMAAGADEKQVLAGMLGSDEYYADAGQTASGFVSALYRDVLGRTPDSGRSFWEDLFSSSPSFLPPVTDLRDFRVALAEIFLSTPEASHKLLDGNFPGAAGNVGAPGTPAIGAFALADLSGNGWDNLYFQGRLSAANVDALFAQLQSGAAYDETIADMLEMSQYFGS